MGKTLIFGHKNPDTDSITSSLVMANLEKKLGNDVEACRLGNINKETEYVLNYLQSLLSCFLNLHSAEPVCFAEFY